MDDDWTRGVSGAMRTAWGVVGVVEQTEGKVRLYKYRSTLIFLAAHVHPPTHFHVQNLDAPVFVTDRWRLVLRSSPPPSPPADDHEFYTGLPAVPRVQICCTRARCNEDCGRCRAPESSHRWRPLLLRQVERGGVV